MMCIPRACVARHALDSVLKHKIHESQAMTKIVSGTLSLPFKGFDQLKTGGLAAGD